MIYRAIMIYRINGKDRAFPRFITVPREFDHEEEMIDWAQRNTIFKTYTKNQIEEALQVWDGEKWKWTHERR